MFKMDAQTLFQKMDIWCQWDSTFGENANALREYFTTHPDTLQSILFHMFTSRGKRPTKKWLREWQEMKTSVPTPLLRPFLLGLAAKQEWYMGLASEADARTLAALENGQHVSNHTRNPTKIEIYGSNAYASKSYQRWRKEGDIWFERFAEYSVPRTRKRAIAKAACWALAEFLDAETRDLLFQLLYAQLRVPVLWTMTQWEDDTTVARLLLVTRLTRRPEILSGIEETLTAIATRRELQVEQLKDRAILTHELNAQGVRTWSIGADTIQLAISPAGRAVRRVEVASGKRLRSLPSELRTTHEKTWQEVLHEAKLLSITLSMQRRRMETAMRERRSWSWEEWQNVFAHHPVSGYFARRLVWAISAQDGTHITYAICNEQGDWLTIDGEAVLISNEHRLHIIHPVEMRPEDHSRWQRYVVTHKMIQPFKQMFRAIYLLTPAEEQTRTYSNRFASHMIPLLGFSKRLLRWQKSYSTNVNWHDFQSHNIRAYIWHKHDYRHNHTTTLQQIAFYPMNHTTLWSRPRLDLDPACLPLVDIPPIIFSETMHDIDQYLVCASEGTDQHWDEDAPSNSYATYETYNNRAPHEREQQLRELLPLLDLGPAVHVEGRSAFINGKYCEYRVDLGNGTIYIEPTGRYLCIVPRYNEQKLYLPFEDNDPKTAEILSKILLLARDETITDTTILRQLPTKG